MITNSEELEAMKKLNTHKCRKCGKVFNNFKGMNEHVKKYKHYEYDLLGEKELALLYA